MSESLDRRLGVREHLELRLHLMVCAWCARYLKQIEFLRHIVRQRTFIETREDANQWSREMTQALRTHWPEYLMEATELGLFMIAACSFTVLLFHPASPLVQVIPTETLRRLVMGAAMGLTRHRDHLFTAG